MKKDEPKLNALKVYAIRNGEESFYSVVDTKEAIDLINKLADADLKNEAIVWNVFGLLVYLGPYDETEDGWSEWYNEAGEDISEVEEREEKKC